MIFGRTSSPEFGISYLTEPAIYGPTRNPWDISRSPGGSSGGAAALVAAGVLPAAQASDGGGSIRIPAACCGLVGLKLTRSRVPTGPKLGESWAGLAGAHVITRSFRDTAAFLDIAKGYDEGQPNHPENAHLIFADTVSRLDRPLRIGVSEYARRLTPTDPEVSGCLTLWKRPSTSCGRSSRPTSRRALPTFAAPCGARGHLRTASNRQPPPASG